MRSEPQSQLPRTWSELDLTLYAFLAVCPFALGLWTFSFAPLVGGNLLIAVVLAGVVMLLGAIVIGSLAGKLPLTGGDYVWQTRLLHTRAGGILALASWWIVVAALAPVYGNVILVQVIDPVLTAAGWDGLASWFRGRDGIFAASLIAIATASAFVGLGMRRAAIAQRCLVVTGSVALVAVLGLFLTASPAEFHRAFRERTHVTYGVVGDGHAHIVGIGTLDARVTDVALADTVELVPVLLLFSLWIGWAGPLAGEVRLRGVDSVRVALIRAATASTLVSLLFMVVLGATVEWEFWNEANNLYWGTVYGTTATTPLPIWPNPVLFATWLTDSTFAHIAVILGMAAWIVGWTATLYLAATRVLLASAWDQVLPPSVGRTRGDSVPVVALGLLVVPACALAALDAYWDAFADWSSSAVAVLALATAGSGLAAVMAFRRESRTIAVVAALFVLLVALVVGSWIAEPLFGIRSLGSLLFLIVVYAAATVAVAMGMRRRARAAGVTGVPAPAD